MVKQVRQRGPFVSLSHFANRALVDLTAATSAANVPLARCGALQSALDNGGANINPLDNKAAFKSLVVNEDKVILQFDGASHPKADVYGEKAAKLETKQSVLAKPKSNEVIYELAYEKDAAWVEQENNIVAVKEEEQAQLMVLQSDASFFTSSDGSKSGFLQTVVLRRSKIDYGMLTELTAAQKKEIHEANLKEEAEMEKRATQKTPRTNAPKGGSTKGGNR